MFLATFLTPLHWSGVFPGLSMTPCSYQQKQMTLTRRSIFSVRDGNRMVLLTVYLAELLHILQYRQYMVIFRLQSQKSGAVSSSEMPFSETALSSARLGSLAEEPNTEPTACNASPYVFLIKCLNWTGTALTHFFTWTSPTILILDAVSRARKSRTSYLSRTKKTTRRRLHCHSPRHDSDDKSDTHLF